MPVLSTFLGTISSCIDVCIEEGLESASSKQK